MDINSQIILPEEERTYCSRCKINLVDIIKTKKDLEGNYESREFICFDCLTEDEKIISGEQ